MEKIVAGAIFLLSFISPSPKIETPVTLPPSPTPIYIVQRDKIHNVESGDTLDSIAKRYYGSSKFWTNLWNDNDWIEDPRLIRQGWELKISSSRTKEATPLKTKLALIYDELTAPAPTPEPAETAVAGASIQAPQGSTGSFDEVYKQAGARYSVPWEILYGIHYMETGLRDGAISSGYGTGAQGPLQFMPGTWASYGVDGNGDGTVDINNAHDAIFGAANYLAAHGGVEAGLRFYGGDTQGILNAARSRGYSQ